MNAALFALGCIFLLLWIAGYVGLIHYGPDLIIWAAIDIGLSIFAQVTEQFRGK